MVKWSALLAGMGSVKVKYQGYELINIVCQRLFMQAC